MEDCFARLAPGFLLIILLWLAVQLHLDPRPGSRSSGRYSEVGFGQQLVKSQQTAITGESLRPDAHSISRSRVNDTQSNTPLVSFNLRLLAIMTLMAICGWLFLGQPPLVFSLQSDLQSFVHHLARTPSSTGLQDVFQVYQPVPFEPNGDNSCDVEILLMEHVFGASYGAPYVGKKRILNITCACGSITNSMQVNMSLRSVTSTLYGSI